MATKAPENQNSTPTGDVQQTIPSFLKVSQYTRYHLDKFLPSLISKSQSVKTDEILHECDALLSSVKAFMQLMKGVPSKLEEAESDFGDVKEMWEWVINELHSSVNCSTGKSEKKGYYCGLCNYCTFCVEEWNNHLKSDKIHSERNNFSSNENMNVQGYRCTVCGLILYSENIHLNIILNSKDHQNLDDFVKNLKIKAQAPHPLTKKMDTASNYHHNISVASQKVHKKIKMEYSSVCLSNRVGNIKAQNSKSKSNGNRNEDISKNLEKNEILHWNNSQHVQESRKKKISKEFIILCEHIRTKDWKESYYCKPCNMIFNNNQKWKSHFSTVNHNKNNVMRVCKICTSALFIYSCHAMDYMNYHMQKCHPDLPQVSNLSPLLLKHNLTNLEKRNTTDPFHKDLFLKVSKNPSELCPQQKENTNSSKSCSTVVHTDNEKGFPIEAKVNNENILLEANKLNESKFSPKVNTDNEKEFQLEGNKNNEKVFSAEAYKNNEKEFQPKVNVPPEVSTKNEEESHLEDNENKETELLPEAKVNNENVPPQANQLNESKFSPKVNTDNEKEFQPEGNKNNEKEVNINNEQKPSPEADKNNGTEINPKFFEVLQQKQNYFFTNRHHSFRGLCLNCSKIFSCQFEWIYHLNMEESEENREIVECSKCSMEVFGKRDLVINVYLQHKKHLSIDELH